MLFRESATANKAFITIRHPLNMTRLVIVDWILLCTYRRAWDACKLLVLMLLLRFRVRFGAWPALARHRHAVLRPQPDGIHCEDVGSLNGSFVNEDRLEDPVVLEDGDVLQVGQSIVKISC